MALGDILCRRTINRGRFVSKADMASSRQVYGYTA
jgi:hypothetical protein